MIIGLIPSRINSTRLKNKPLLEIDGLPIIVHTLKRSQLSKKLDKVIVCTDSDRIVEVVRKHGGEALMTSAEHKNGTERIAEVSDKFKCDLVVDIQGDEPLVSPQDIDAVIDFHKKNKHFDAVVPCVKTDNPESRHVIKVIKTKKNDLSYPKIDYNIILKSPEFLQSNQSEFSKTGGIHASALIGNKGEVIAIREDVGRHNALDKLIGHALKNKIIKPENQFIACSGRLNFELVQKALMSDIGLMAGVGAPTSLAIDLAKRFDMTLVGFVKSDSFNIYCNKNRILIKN